MTPTIPSVPGMLVPGVEAAITAIVISLLNTFWIPAAAAIGLVLAFRFLRGWNAATRYALCWAVLATVFLAPMIPSFFAHESAVAREPVLPPSTPIPAATSDGQDDFPQSLEPAPEIATDPVKEPIAAAPLTPVLSIEEHAPSDLAAPDPPAATAPAALTLTPGRWTWIALALWFSWLLYRSARIAQSYLYLRRIKGSAEPADHPSNGALEARFTRLLTEHGIRPNARLLISRNIAAPIAVGFIHPPFLSIYLGS